ncbi:MAG: hypothetical protein HC817_04135 [Saprospiraceae bacterium]|nr:hypothetical protein [Saprospiraceae bacterium]
MIIPRNAIQLQNNTPSVFVLKNDKVVKKNIEIGQNFENSIVILRGLAEGEKVVVSSVENLQAGQVVKVN